MKNKIKSVLISRLDIMLILFLILGVGFLYSYVAVISHNHFQTFAWDLGFFDQIIWKVSRGDLVAYSTIAHENLMADHFQAVLYLLSPLYKIISDVRMILAAQAILVTIAAYPLYLIAKSLSKNAIFAFGVVIAYLLFLGTQWTILNEFHQTAFLPLFLVLFFYSLVNNKLWLYGLSSLGILATKEEYALLLAALGLIVWWFYKKKILGIMTFILSVFSFFFLVNFLMPKLSVNNIYSHYDFGTSGYTPEDVIKNSLNNPRLFLESMVSPRIKVITVAQSFLGFGFLPFFNPILLVPVIENFVTRFIYAGPQFTQWVNVNQHAAPLGILLAVGSIYSSIALAQIINRKKKIKTHKILTVLGFYLIFIAITQDILLHGPVNSLFKKQFYESSDWIKDNDEVIAKVPSNVPLAAQNSMLPHVSQRKEVFLLPEMGNSEFILLDLQDGPNKYSPLTYKEMKNFVHGLSVNQQYSIVYQKGEALLLKRTQTDSSKNK